MVTWENLTLFKWGYLFSLPYILLKVMGELEPILTDLGGRDRMLPGPVSENKIIRTDWTIKSLAWNQYACFCDGSARPTQVR